MYSCQELLNELANYLDDQVAAEIRKELEGHLSRCRPCRVLMDSTRQTLKIVTECRSFELPVDISARIMAKIRASQEKP